MAYNFFEPFLREVKPEKKNNTNLIIFTLMILAVGFIGASFGYTIFQKKNLEKEIAEVDMFFEDEVIKAKIVEIDAKLAEIQDIKLKQQYLQYLEKDMKSIDVVNDQLLDFIKNEIVQDLSVDSLSIDQQGKVSLQGVSLTKMGIAQFEHDLRNSGKFHEVFVPNIKKDEAYFSFNIEFDTVVGGEQ
ncbi:MAG: PilN domain-containing protein [Peptostreptococcaceae bacterium]|nr:PilN domain-containing protein [Peptostreptococcaceae bacterium]